MMTTFSYWEPHRRRPVRRQMPDWSRTALLNVYLQAGNRPGHSAAAWRVFSAAERLPGHDPAATPPRSWIH